MFINRGLILATFAVLIAGSARADSPTGPDGKRAAAELVSRLGDAPLKHTKGSTSQMVIGAVFSPDGKLVASAGWDHLIRLWNAETGRELRQFVGHKGPVYGVAFSPDGLTIASGSEDHTIRLWDVATAKERLEMKGHSGGVTRVVFTPDGRYLASGSYDRSVRLWSVKDGKEIRQFGGQQKGFTTICFSPDGRYLASGCGDHAACLWETATGREVRRFQGHYGAVVGVAYSPDGSLLATASEDRTVIVWEVWSARPCFRLRGHRNGAWAVAFSPDGRLLASAGRDRTIRMWDTETGNPICQAEAHKQGIPMLAFSPDGRALVSSSHDGSAAIRELRNVYPAGPIAEIKLSPTELAHLWEALAHSDPARAHAAVARLSAAPGQAVPWLRGQVRPVTPIADQRIAQLVADLDSNTFSKRQRASDELELLAERALPALRQALERKPSLEVKQRAERLLARLDSPITSPELLRALRTVRVLERTGSADARNHLAKLADGAPGALLTEMSRQAVVRMSRRPSH